MKESLTYRAFQNSKLLSSKLSTYFDVYDHLFSQYRNKNITFVEVGARNGGSLQMWRNYFGESASIIGIDLNPSSIILRDHGFEIFIGNQSDPEFWDEFFREVGEVDILIDDGGHSYVQQIVTTEKVLPNIKNGGLIVVEDTHSSYIKGFGDLKISFINYVKVWIDRINKRFYMFDNGKVDKTVWSVEIFESIVAFKIDRKKAAVASRLIHNVSLDDTAPQADFRFKDNEFLKRNENIIRTIIKNAFSLN